MSNKEIKFHGQKIPAKVHILIFGQPLAQPPSCAHTALQAGPKGDKISLSLRSDTIHYRWPWYFTDIVRH